MNRYNLAKFAKRIIFPKGETYIFGETKIWFKVGS